MSATKSKGTPSLHRGKKEPGNVSRLYDTRIWFWIGNFETRERAESYIHEWRGRKVPKSYFKVVRHSWISGGQTVKGFMALIKRSFTDGHRPCACGKR